MKKRSAFRIQNKVGNQKNDSSSTVRLLRQGQYSPIFFSRFFISPHNSQHDIANINLNFFITVGTVMRPPETTDCDSLTIKVVVEAPFDIIILEFRKLCF